MLKKLISLATSIKYPQFQELEYLAMLPTFKSQLSSKIYYTPKLQKQVFTDQLLRYLAYLQRKETVTKTDMKKLTQNMIIQYGNIYKKMELQNQQFTVHKNFIIKPDGICPYHGRVDYLVAINHQHFFPILFFDKYINNFAGPAAAMSNMVMKSNLRKQPKTSGYSILTNGQQWIMYKVFRNLQMQKTMIYQGRNKLRTIYEDYQMIAVILGLMDYCMDLDRADVQTLKIAYDFIDQKKYMIQAKEGDEIKVEPLASRILSNYYKNMADNNSK